MKDIIDLRRFELLRREIFERINSKFNNKKKELKVEFRFLI